MPATCISSCTLCAPSASAHPEMGHQEPTGLVAVGAINYVVASLAAAALAMASGGFGLTTVALGSALLGVSDTSSPISSTIGQSSSSALECPQPSSAWRSSLQLSRPSSCGGAPGPPSDRRHPACPDQPATSQPAAGRQVSQVRGPVWIWSWPPSRPRALALSLRRSSMRVERHLPNQRCWRFGSGRPPSCR